MNRFDRIVSIWMLLQTKRVITAQDMADKFEVSIRTIYRDVRSLELAGVPILSEAGVGYSLDRGYKLPPVVFDREEALALFVAEKFIEQSSDDVTKEAYQRALTKIRAVLTEKDKYHLDSLDDRIKVHADPIQSSQIDPWLMQVQHAIAHSQVIEIDYFTQSRRSMESRPVEPIGLYFYSRHWHLIAWCRLREDFRDFRLDRIKHLSNTGAWFDQRSRGDLDTYLKQNRTQVPLERAEVVFESSVAPFTHNQRHWYGFIEQVVEKDGRVKMVFLAPSLEFLGRWLMSYTDAVRIVSPQALKDKMQHLIGELERSLT